MIFLKIFCKLISVSGLMMLFLSGCSVVSGMKETSEISGVSEITDSAENETITSEAASETEYEPLSEEATEISDAVYVRDFAGVLSNADENAIQSRIDRLYSEYMINAAVVTVSDLGGKDAAIFAEEMFDSFYGGEGNGFVFVLNNDTNKDYLLKTGVCADFVSEETESRQLFSSTKLFAEENYRDGIEGMLSLAENCPDRVFDELGVFSIEETEYLQEKLNNCYNDISAVILGNNMGLECEELCRVYCERRYADGDGYMIMIDSVSANAYVYSENYISDDIAYALENAWYSIAEGDYYSAVDTVASCIG